MLQSTRTCTTVLFGVWGSTYSNSNLGTLLLLQKRIARVIIRADFQAYLDQFYELLSFLTK